MSDTFQGVQTCKESKCLKSNPGALAGHFHGSFGHIGNDFWNQKGRIREPHGAKKNRQDSTGIILITSGVLSIIYRKIIQ